VEFCKRAYGIWQRFLWITAGPIDMMFYAWKQLLLSARLSHRNSVRPSVCPSVCHTGGSVKNGAS